mmetsp:Transcript_89416/g.158701  ORF Transcript_89416/g.158701 Transcript_89416/m.158701 type:complete len:103 (+) Transcript_89416:1489-1797(+)
MAFVTSEAPDDRRLRWLSDFNAAGTWSPANVSARITGHKSTLAEESPRSSTFCKSKDGLWWLWAASCGGAAGSNVDNELLATDTNYARKTTIEPTTAPSEWS